MINRITVDIDVTDLKTAIYKLIKNYIYARIKFGKDKVSVYLTSSKRGFRIYIEEKVDVLTNLLERALMDDDPYRIFFSLKRYAMTKNEEEIDVEFYSKKYLKTGREGTITKIDMEQILTKEFIEKLEETYSTKEFEDLIKSNIENLVSKFKEIVKTQEVLYILVDKKHIDFLAENLLEENVKFRVFADIYDENNVVFRIIGQKERLDELINKYKDIIKKYRFVTEESKI